MLPIHNNVKRGTGEQCEQVQLQKVQSHSFLRNTTRYATMQQDKKIKPPHILLLFPLTDQTKTAWPAQDKAPPASLASQPLHHTPISTAAFRSTASTPPAFGGAPLPRSQLPPSWREPAARNKHTRYKHEIQTHVACERGTGDGLRGKIAGLSDTSNVSDNTQSAPGKQKVIARMQAETCI